MTFAPTEARAKTNRRWFAGKNGSTKIGLFQGMFERNMLTFNPGWNSKKEELADFQDVRVARVYVQGVARGGGSRRLIVGVEEIA